jgi:NAD+ kinase
MKRVAVVYNPHSPETERLSHELSGWLHARGIEVWRGISSQGRSPHVLDGVDLIVALGGDGTVLRAAHLAFNTDVPVLPVALGHLNFMAELLPENLYEGMETLLTGGGWLDVRTLVDATVYHNHEGGGEPDHAVALNEILMARGDINRTVVVDVEIYDAHLTTYHADGVLLATATGSTAYALSAGGPIVDPRARALVLVPVAAHLTNVPSLVLHEDAVVTLTLRSRYPAAFSADGRDHIALHEGDVVVVRRSQQTCTFARVYPQSTFYSRMTRRLRRD